VTRPTCERSQVFSGGSAFSAAAAELLISLRLPTYLPAFPHLAQLTALRTLSAAAGPALPSRRLMATGPPAAAGGLDASWMPASLALPPSLEELEVRIRIRAPGSWRSSRSA
jgi:hypothetical protein